MRLALLVAMAACGSDYVPPVPTPTVPFTACGGDPASFVRAAFLALDGRRPMSQAEVDVYVDLYTAVGATADPKVIVSRAIMAQPEFAEHWIDVVMDAIRVQRLDVQTEAACWGTGTRTPTTPLLAMMIRDQPATSPGDGGSWTMIDLARSAIALDDLSPIIRAQLFSLVSHPITAANVDPTDAELARRADFGETFDSGDLHRDMVCLACHNSEHSVTDNDNPALDRFWPVPGLPERAVYGTSTPTDYDAAHAAFRVDSFVASGHVHPWGWNAACGEFADPASIPDDIAGISAQLASVVGLRATVYDLEAALARGFTALRGQLPPIGLDGSIADPDTALAWLVVLKLTEDMWTQVTGTPLTIANYYPRNEASSDLLYALASRFTQSGFSLKALLAAIVETDYFDRLPPEAACGASPYTYPNVYDPWAIDDPNPALQLNGPGDAVVAVDARTLVSAANAALEWPAAPGASRFPDDGDTTCPDESCTQMQSDCAGFDQCCDVYNDACVLGGVMPAIEVPFERGVGMFLRNSERGFRGLDFQARLVWENQLGACTRPAWVSADFIDRLVAAGAADPNALASDVISALKDRLIGEPTIADPAEQAALASLIGSLDAPASNVDPDAVRRVCGALLESPQFLMSGIVGRGGDRPRLTPVDASYSAICTDLVTRGVPGYVATCASGTLVLQ